jgi:hypothetical protein
VAETPDVTLHLALKGEYFDAIKAGRKTEEFRRICPYWEKRLARSFTRIILTRGYPKASDLARRLELRWNGMRTTWITGHPLFGPGPVEVYAINVRYVTKHRHGADPAEWPKDLRVQEFPI